MADLQPFVPAGEAMASLPSPHPATPFASARHGRRHRPTSHPLPAWFHEPESEHHPRVRQRPKFQKCCTSDVHKGTRGCKLEFFSVFLTTHKFKKPYPVAPINEPLFK